MLDHIKEDYRVHGRSLTNLAFWAMVTYRFGRWSNNLRNLPFRWVCGKVYGALYLLTGIVCGVHMPREVTIGKNFHIVHVEGSISIHPDTVIGDNVGIMHNVTIGENMTEGAPVIGDDVFIGVGAVVIGSITVGDGARIAANSLVMNDIPAGSVAMGVPAKVIPTIAGLITKRSK